MQGERLAAILLLAAALAVVPACGALGTSGPQRPQSRDDIICTNEAQTGSHIVETRCLTRGEIEDRRKADNEMIERAVINANRPRRPQPGQTPSQ